MNFSGIYRYSVLSLTVPALMGLASVNASEAVATREFANGGYIGLKLSSAPQDASLSLEYGRVDPISPVSIEMSRKLQDGQQVPVMVHDGTRLLTLQSLKVLASDRKSLIQLSRTDLDPVRKRARTGASLILDFSSVDAATFKTQIEPREEYELPAQANGPGLAFLDKDLIELIRLDDLEDSLLRVRAVSSASDGFHQELIDLAQKSPAIDASRLQLLLDGASFPSESVIAMKRRFRELPDNLENAQLRRTLSQNLVLAERFAPMSNRLLMVGLVRIKSLKFPAADALLSRIQDGPDSMELAFQQALEKLGGTFEALRPDQKNRLFSLAAQKSALEFAVSIGRDCFLKDSDKTVGALLDLVRQIPTGSRRDELTRLASQSTGPVSVPEFAALTSPIQSDEVTLELYQSVASRITQLSATQVMTLLSGRPSGAFRDRLILFAIQSVATFDGAALRNLVLGCSAWSCRQELVKSSFTRIAGSAPAVLADIIQILPSESDRDSLVTITIDLAASTTTQELMGLFLATLTEPAATMLFDRGLLKLAPLKVVEAAAFSDGLYKPGFAIETFRDRILLRAAEIATDLDATNLSQLTSRASTDAVRATIQQIGESRTTQRP